MPKENPVVAFFFLKAFCFVAIIQESGCSTELRKPEPRGTKEFPHEIQCICYWSGKLSSDLSIGISLLTELQKVDFRAGITPNLYPLASK